jgi:hypothetical protein
MARFPKSNFSAHSLSSSQTNVPGLSADSAQRIDEEKYRKIAKVPSVKGLRVGTVDSFRRSRLTTTFLQEIGGRS